MNKFEKILYKVVYVIFIISAMSFLWIEQHNRFESFVVSALLIMFAFLYDIWKKTLFDQK